MRLTKFGHSCVRISYDDTTLVLDPGGWSQPEAVDGADAVLITHEHPDHWHADHLRRTDAPIFTIAAVASAIAEGAPDLSERITVVAPGQAWEIDGLPVRTVGEKHAVIHPELPHFDNSGYLVECGETIVFHPGDAISESPSSPVDVLLAPVCAPWMRVSEGIEFAREVGAARNVAIHDRVFSPEGLGVADAHFGRFLDADGLDYVRLADGADLA